MFDIDKYTSRFLEQYARYVEFSKTNEFVVLYNFLVANKQKLIWAIEELGFPPIEGVGKSLLQLDIDFNDVEIRRITGAMIAVILSDEYKPYESGKRVKCKPFITSSLYRKI